MQKTHRPHHRSSSRDHVGYFLNLLPIAQSVSNRPSLGDATDPTLDDRDVPIVSTVESRNCCVVPCGPEAIT